MKITCWIVRGFYNLEVCVYSEHSVVPIPYWCKSFDARFQFQNQLLVVHSARRSGISVSKFHAFGVDVRSKVM
jgi:hypothetical protein